MSPDIFDELEKLDKKSLFKNQRIFAEDYAPKSTSEVIHRDTQIEEIAECIYNTTKRVRSELYIFGVAGVGKTYTVRAVLNDASIRYAKKFQYAWINCKMIKPLSDFQVMNEICEQLGYPFKKEGKGHATKVIEQRVIDRHKETPLLIVFDEADALVKKHGVERILYTFFDKGVSQILLSNVFGWVEKADSRIKSRSQGHSTDFGTYSADQLKDILSFIAKKGLKKGVISGEILAKIAEDTTDTFMGDVRKAKILMSSSVQLAMKEGVKAVTEEHLAKAIPKIESASLVNILKNFGRHELVALAGFVCQRINVTDSQRGGYALQPREKGNPATTENIHHFYKKCAELNGFKPVTPTMMKNYLQRLVLSGILEREITSHSPTRGRTNVYYSKYILLQLGNALQELGIKGCGAGYMVSFDSSDRAREEFGQKWLE